MLKTPNRKLYILSVLCSAVLSTATACTLRAPERAKVQISLPQKVAPSSLLQSALLANPTSLSDFQCFGVNVTGPEIAPHPQYGGCSNANLPYVGVVGGLASVSGGSVDLEVPVGVRRNIQLFAVQSTIGCPAIEDGVIGKFGTSEMSNPVLVGSAVADVMNDVSVTILAKYESANPKPMFCPSTKPTQFKIVDPDSGSGASAIQYASACKRYEIGLADASGQPAVADTPVVIGLGSPSLGNFYSDSACTSSISSVTLASGAGSGAFYFKDDFQDTFAFSPSTGDLSFSGFNVAVYPSFASGVQPTSVVVNAGTVYWSDSLDWGNPTSSVKKASTAGGGITVLASGIAYTSSLAVDGTYVYWIDNGSSHKVPVGGGGVMTVAPGYNTNLVADGTYLYWGFSPNGVQRWDSGSGVVTLDPDTNVGAAPFAVAVNATDVFWANWNGDLKRIPIAGGSNTFLANGVYASALMATSTHVYWTDSSGVHSIPVGGGAATLLAPGAPKCMASDGSYIYWAEASSVKKVPMGGGPVTTLASGLTTSYVQNGSVTSYCIAVDATDVYWATQSGLYRVVK